MFGPKREEGAGDWSVELHSLFALPNVIRVIKSRRMILADHVARMGEIRNAYNILVGKPEVKGQLERPRHR
jgi:hypothetical protein